MKIENLNDHDLCELLKNEDASAWKHFLKVLVDQEKKSCANNRKRFDWGVAIEDLLGRLYEDMIYNKRLWKWQGRGSLYGWVRVYLRQYLNEYNPAGDGRTVDIEDGIEDEEGRVAMTLGDKISAEVSEINRKDPYGGEDLQVLQHERWEIAGKCFRDLWQENSIQAYVLLLKTRFHMSSLEIKERFGVSSAANVDQMFARAVKKMKEARVKYEI